RSSNSWSWRPVRTPPGPFGAEVLGVLPHPFEGVDGGGERPLELAQDTCTPCEDRAHRAQGIGVRAPESAHPRRSPCSSPAPAVPAPAVGPTVIGRRGTDHGEDSPSRGLHG